MPFSDIPGNGRVKNILRLSLSRGRAPHSLLFHGPRGIGKLKTARVLAKALNCLTLPDDACDACPNCVALNRGLEDPELSFPDYVEVEAETEEIKITQMKEIREIAYIKPMIGRKRIFVINEAERLNEESGNCLLKVLEEPPGWSYFILVTEYPSRILPTIRSRCRPLAFMPVATEEIEQALRDRGFEEEKARILALLVHGNLEQALGLDWDEIQGRRGETWDLFRAMVTGEEASRFLRKYAYQKKAEIKDDLKSTLELFASFCRDLVLLRDDGDPTLLLNPDYEPRLREIGGGAGFGRAVRFLDAIDAAFADLDRSLNTGLLIASLYSHVQG